MILDHLSHANRYSPLHPGFAAAFALLRSDVWHTWEPGRHEVDGTRLFVSLGRDMGREQAGAKLEAHRRYIDVQYLVSGEERIGWKKLDDCQQVLSPYHETSDVMFFSDTPSSWFDLPVGSFSIFYPTDAHAPLAGRGPLHKVVVKVAVEW